VALKVLELASVDTDLANESALSISKLQHESAVSLERGPDIIVFSQPSSSKAHPTSKTLARSFMVHTLFDSMHLFVVWSLFFQSSKVSKISAPIDDNGGEVSRKTNKNDEEDPERYELFFHLLLPLLLIKPLDIALKQAMTLNYIA
jgi:hypothetical protein